MKTSTWLRIAALLALLLAIGHTLGTPWTPIKTAEAGAVVEAMRAVHFTIEGADHTYFDFYEGLGWSSGVLCFTLAILLWRQAGWINSGRPVDRGLIAIECLGFALNAGVTGFFIALMPAAFSGAVALILTSALFATRGSAST